MVGLLKVSLRRSRFSSCVRELTARTKATFAIEILYYCIVFAVKSSIIFLYLRLGKILTVLSNESAKSCPAATTTFRNLCYGTLAFLTLALISSLLTTSLQCIPIAAAWDITGVVKAKARCINSTAFFYCKESCCHRRIFWANCIITATSGYNIVLDIWIIALPIKTLLSIHRPKREKVVLLGVFLMGVFSCIASIIRLYTIRIFTTSQDPFFDAVPVNLWSMVEINVAMICASIPCLKPLISKTVRDRMASMNSSHRQYQSYAKNSHSDNSSFPADFKGEPLPSPGIELRAPVGAKIPQSPNHARSGTFYDEEQAPVLGGIQRGFNFSQVSEADSENPGRAGGYSSITTRIGTGMPHNSSRRP